MADKSTLAELQKSMQVLITSVAALTSKVEAIELKLDNMELVNRNVEQVTKEMVKVKETVNRVDQDSRACLVRISGLSVSDAEMKQYGFEKSIIKKTYDKIVKPILSIAKNNGDIESVPTMLNVLEQGYVASRGGTDKQGKAMPPVLAVRFTNRFLRNTVMRLRREHIPSPSDAERAAGVSRYYINEDLTPDTAHKVKELRSCELVERVWTIDGRIRFTKVGDPNHIIKISSPFVSLEEALSLNATKK
jgi:hypothetical protein